jgi:tetratricopeptide (TPR) repeat protein
MPLIERFGGDEQKCTALNNYGNLLALQGRPKEAIPYFERALTINKKIGDLRRETQFLNNLADSYDQLGRFEQSLNTYLQCIDINQKNNWLENLVFNYQGISMVYEETSDFKSALNYFKKFHSLRDSLVGADTHDKIAELEIKYESQQKELALHTSNAKLDSAHRTLERGAFLFCLVLVLIIFGLWQWRIQSNHAVRQQIQNKETLNDLTRVLKDKNMQLLTLEKQVSEPIPRNWKSPEPDDFEENVFNQHILTDRDWAAFKIYFEKTYPGYLLRLRNKFPALSDAEERLFLFIKLNLNRKESAAILGISTDSVKRTRNRLRKRLGLDEDIDLEVFIRSF